MEYFNFEDATNALPHFDLDDYSSFTGDADFNLHEASDYFEPAVVGKPNGLPTDNSATTSPVKLKLMNDIEIEVIPAQGDASLDYPMFRAKAACDLCSRMGLDCFLTTRGTGTLITGCTCCISLYRECSFTHPKLPKGLISTFPGISEDRQVCEGSLTERRKSLKSFDEARGRKTGARFPRDAVKILKQWLTQHSDHPYPNEREKDELKRLTGLKRSQISNWLANARRRGKVRPTSGPPSPVLGAIDIPQSKSSDTSVSDLNPMERWKASPPENEPASMTAIARAVTGIPLPGRQSSQSSMPTSRKGSKPGSEKASSEDDSNYSMFREPSVSSFDTKKSSNSDMTFASSQSKGSKGSSQERRRRRRAPMTQRTAAQQAKSRSARIFQCTFCTDTFPAKYDWQRHEKSLHLALERWSCCPQGGTFTGLTGGPHCVFCQVASPSQEHLESHNFVACQEKTLQERTFYRKDHLRQHLKLMHNAKFEKHMESWKDTTNEIKSACGFCPSKFTMWQQRADHLAAHFRNGADMSMWANGWGFDSHIEKLVENAIPPYLIGHERSTMDPYVARLQKTPSSRGATDSGLTYGTSVTGESEPDQITKDSNCWGRLEQELAKFVAQQRIVGQMPSDKDIQDKARYIIYEDDDPWNWTCADNQQWLDTFKFQHGVGGITEAMQTKQLAEVPVLAPYVIKGGLKTKSNQNAHARAGSTSSAASGSSRRGTSQPQPPQQPLPPVRGPRGSVGSVSSFGSGTGIGSMIQSTTPHQTSKSFSSSPAPLPNFNPHTELDFDSIDFSTLNLDLGMTDDGDMNMNHAHQMQTHGLGMGMDIPMSMNLDNNMDMTMSGSTGQHHQQYVPAQSLTPNMNSNIDDVFGNFDINMNPMDTNMEMSTMPLVGELPHDFHSHQRFGQSRGQAQKQQTQMQQMDDAQMFMSEHELEQLTGYTSGFGSLK